MDRVAVIIGSDQGRGTRTAAPATLSKSDQAAVGLAAQRFHGQIEAYCLHDDPEALRYALAAGAVTARLLEDVTGLDVDVVLVGSGGAEPYGDVLLAWLAEAQQCAMVFDVIDVVPYPEGLRVTRDLGYGSREVLALDRPVVLGISEDALQLLYVSRFRRQAVPSSRLVSPPESLQARVSPLASAWEPLRPRVRTGDLGSRTSGAADMRRQALFGGGDSVNDRSHVIMADAATCAQHLLRFLSHHGIITATVAPPAPLMPAERFDTQRRPEVVVPWRPHQRWPRPLRGAGRGRERLPRPLSSAVVAPPAPASEAARRAPRPPGTPAPRQPRGPRPLQEQDK